MPFKDGTPKPSEWVALARAGRRRHLSVGAEARGATIDGIRAQVQLQELAVEGLTLRMELQRMNAYTRQMETETAADIEREVHTAADRLRAADPRLTTEGALALAWNDDAYARYDAAAARQAGVVTTAASVLAPPPAPTSSQTKLDLAIAEQVKANPRLTDEQSFALALEKNPDLYEG